MDYQKIIVKSRDEVIWPFKGNPHFSHKAPYGWGRNIEIDPFPTTVTDVKIVEERVPVIESKFPIGTILQWVILPHEVMERSNAWANYDYLYCDNTEEGSLIQKKHKMTGLVVFSGKRGNIHPAMTRFLVAHEYGHQVDYWINALMKAEEDSRDEDLFHKRYAEVRGLEFKDDTNYGGGNYHDSLVEIIADDFRIVMGETDPDFYQHSCVNPLDCPSIIQYWNDLRNKYGFDIWWPEQAPKLN